MDDGPQWVIIGIGNPDRGDDGAGRRAARLLRERLPSEVKVVEASGEASALLNELAAARSVILIDACMGDSRAGAIHRFDVAAESLPATFQDLSSHGLGVGVAIELARSLDQLPKRCILYAIEARQFDIKTGTSPDMDAAINEVCDRIAQDVLAG